MISYNQTSWHYFMNKHILAEHPDVWHRWKIVNLSLAMEEEEEQKYKMKFMVSYKAITYHFQSTIHKKDDAQHKIQRGLAIIVAKTYMHISIVESHWLWHLVLCQNL